MLGWALLLLVFALIAGAFGFRGAAGLATSFAKLLFFIFLVMFVLALVFK